MIESSFPCDQCGACCRNVSLAKETSYLDRGDGICLNYNEITKLCLIYESRPSICRVDAQYELTYHTDYSWSEFVDVNLAMCDELKKS